jgi:hypothetical protein
MNGVTTDDDVITKLNAGDGCFKVVTAEANHGEKFS